MGIFRKLGAYLSLFRKARRTPKLAGLLWRRKALMAGVGAYEMALLACDQVDARLKTLGSIKVSSLVGCSF